MALNKSEKKSRRLAPFVLVGVALFWAFFDQLVKKWAEDTLTPHTPIPVIGEKLQWYLVYNPGAAFSFLANATWVFTLLASIVTVFLITRIRTVSSMRWAFVLGLMLGGTIGNLYDRLLRPPGFAVGHVVDMISTPWLLPAVYNVADIGLVIGVILTGVLILKGVPMQQRVAAGQTAVNNSQGL